MEFVGHKPAMSFAISLFLTSPTTSPHNITSPKLLAHSQFQNQTLKFEF